MILLPLSRFGNLAMRSIRHHAARSFPLFCAGMLTMATASAGGSSLELSRGIVVDDEGGVAYVADGLGHAQAIDLASGQRRWRSDAIGLPLALANGRLLVLSGHVDRRAERIDLLDPGTGDKHAHLDLPLPEGVQAVVLPRPERRFEVVMSGSGSSLRLHWQYTTRALRGDQPEEGATAASTRSGAFDLDLAASRAHVVSEPAVPNLPRLIPNLQGDERLAQVSGPQFRAADDRHVLASEPVSDAQFGTAYRWNIHLRGDGAKLGSVKAPQSTAPFIVRDTTLIARVEPYALRQSGGDLQYRNARLAAFDLVSGKELWSHDVIDARFRGLMPP
jgi:hypothetical protein